MVDPMTTHLGKGGRGCLDNLWQFKQKHVYKHEAVFCFGQKQIVVKFSDTQQDEWK